MIDNDKRPSMTSWAGIIIRPAVEPLRTRNLMGIFLRIAPHGRDAKAGEANEKNCDLTAGLARVDWPT